MIYKALKKGDILRNENSGKFYQVVKFTDFVFLVDIEKIAAGVDSLQICDFWRVSGTYLKNNFTTV